MANTSNSTSECVEHDHYSTIRFSLIICASAVAFLGIVTNSLLLAIFVRLTKAERPLNMSHLYLVLLSFCDACFCLGFFVIFGLDALGLYLHLVFIFHLYFVVIVFIFTLSRVVQLATPYLIIVSTFERCMISSRRANSRWVRCLTANCTRVVISACIACLAVLVRLPCAWAYYVERFNCTEDVFGRKQLYPTALAFEPLYKFVQFYVVNTLGVFVPFLALIPLNLAIMQNIRQARLHQGSKATVGRMLRVLRDTPTANQVESIQHVDEVIETAEDESHRQKAQRNATIITMMVIVSSYILCTTPSFTLTILEQFFPSAIKNADGSSTALYLVWADMVSILMMFSSFSRLFIFSKCNPLVRNELQRMLGLAHEDRDIDRNENLEVTMTLLANSVE